MGPGSRATTDFIISMEQSQVKATYYLIQSGDRPPSKMRNLDTIQKHLACFILFECSDTTVLSVVNMREV